MKIMKFLAVLTVVLGITYTVLDRHLFFYGKNDLDIYGQLPFKIKPEYKPEFEGGFTIWDEYGISLAAKGVKFFGSDIEVVEIIKYSFDNERIVVQVEETKGDLFFVEFRENTDAQSNQDLKIRIFSISDGFDASNLDWIQIQNNSSHIKWLELPRNYTMFIIIALLLILVFKVIRYRKAPTTT